MIIVEGVDASGKSTLVKFLAQALRLPVQGSEGPPHYEGEMEKRIQRYSTLPPTIFDRHPIISQSIYGSMRSHRDTFDSKWHDWLYNEKKPFIIYCDPGERGLTGHVRNTVDTDEHLEQVRISYDTLRLHYRNWAINRAHFFYRIGDDMNRVLHAVSPRVDLYDDIRMFHEKYQLEYNGPPRSLPEELARFRTNFMQEELTEYNGSHDLHDELDALVDLVYVALGTAYLHGFDFNEAWRRVQSANMRKVRAERAGDSKRGSTYDVVKPPGWTPPDLSDLVVDRSV